MKKNVISIIPARGGSKSIKNKNIKEFCGKPLLAWAIEESLKAKTVDRTIVSTDCEETARIAKEYGAEVPYLRDTSLATDQMAIEPVLADVCKWLEENENYKVDHVCLLQPTNPLRESSQIDECVELMMKDEKECVVTVNEIPANHTPYWSLSVKDDGTITYFNQKNMVSKYKRRQDFPAESIAYNNLVFVINAKNFKLEPPLNVFGKGENVAIVRTPAFYDGDINTEEEWVITENIFTYLRKIKVS